MISQLPFSQFLSTNISLSSLELNVIDVPQKETFVSAIGERTSRKALIVKWINNNGIIGYGECSCRPDPFYSHEYVDGAVQVIKEFIYPLLREAGTYQDVLKALNKIRGWNFTKAAIEFAMNDAIRRESGKGIIEASGLEQLKSVPVGISLGLFDSADNLFSKIEEVSDLNYQRIKFKISPGYDNETIIASLATLQHNNISFDANGSFTEDSFALLNRFAGLGHLIEQPFPAGDMFLHQEYLKQYQPFKICLDEDIESYGNLVSLVLQMDEVNIKPGRVGGLFNSLKMIEYCQRHGLAAWIGGMFETGIGRAQNLQIAALLPEAKAHDLSPSSRYFAKDILLKPISMDNGHIEADNFMNISVDEEALTGMTIDKIILKK
jgi:O-succinylbenzoate synthase